MSKHACAAGHWSDVSCRNSSVRERSLQPHRHRYFADLYPGACQRVGCVVPSRPAGRNPDAVYLEATRVHGAPGAEQIVECIGAHLDVVHIVPTDIGIDQQRRLEEGRSVRGLGEQAAIETVEHFLRGKADAEALLLFEDSDIGKRRAIVDARVSLISTGDFLRELEAVGLTQSTDYILDQAAMHGRNIERQRRSGADTQSRATFRQQLSGSRDISGQN